jgi:hypothetical protein
VQVREAALDDPSLASEPGSVRDATLGDDRLDPPRPEQPAVLDEVIAAVGQHGVGFLARAADLAGHRPGGEVIEQRQQLGDVVAVAAGQRDGQRNAGRVDQQVVL